MINNFKLNFDAEFQKIMFSYFLIAALDYLDEIKNMDEETKNLIIDWIYQQQIHDGNDE
jgi:hypothetical protein